LYTYLQKKNSLKEPLRDSGRRLWYSSGAQDMGRLYWLCRSALRWQFQWLSFYIYIQKYFCSLNGMSTALLYLIPAAKTIWQRSEKNDAYWCLFLKVQLPIGIGLGRWPECYPVFPSLIPCSYCLYKDPEERHPHVVSNPSESSQSSVGLWMVTVDHHPQAYRSLFKEINCPIHGTVGNHVH
jgi:hypothetical protein